MNKTFKVFRSFEYDGYPLYIKDGENIVTDIQLTVKKRDPGTYYSPPLILHEAEAQNLLQELWNAGLRPNNGEGASAQVDALKFHLEDMRKLVFALPIKEIK